MFWLMKSEPSECSFEDVCALPLHTVSWWGVRNYQARNFMRDTMQPGDDVFFYHSSCPKPGIAGLARVVSTAYPDELQFDPTSIYFDPKSSYEKPRWLAVDVQAVARIDPIDLSELRSFPELSNLRILSRGNRLSITPVEDADAQFILKHLVRNRQNVA